MKAFLNILVSLSVFYTLVTTQAFAQQSPSEATNIRLGTDTQTKKLVITYDLLSVQPNDSLYVEIETSSGRRFRPAALTGNVGKSLIAGPNRIIYWDVVKDKVQLNEDVDVVIRIVRTALAKPVVAAEKKQPAGPVVSVPRKSPLPAIGWIATGGLAVYTFSLAAGLNKDVDAYNQSTRATDINAWNAAEAQRSNIDSRRGTFTVVAGITAALAVTNVVWLIVRKGKQNRTSWNIQPGGSGVQIGMVRKF